MGIDGIKSSISNLVSTAQKKVAEVVVKPPTPSAPPAAPSKPREQFTDPKAKPVSITGKHVSHAPGAGEVKADLKASVASIRALAQSGVASTSITSVTVGGKASAGDVDALKKAVASKSDTDIRKLVNDNPALARSLSPAEKGQALEALRSGVCTSADEKAMVNIVRSCETKGELRATLQAAAGGTSQKEMHKFDKELTDHHPYLIADLLNPANTSLPEVHPDSISAKNHITSASNYPSSDMSQKVSLAKGDEAGRKAFLEGLTQVDSKRKTSPEHTDGCGAMCVIGSAMQSDDPKGAMSKLCDYNIKNMDGRDGMPKLEQRKEQLTELKKRIDAGEPISKADVNLLQETTYNTLQAKESKIPGANNENRTVDLRAVEPFLKDAGIGTSGGVPTLVDLDQAPETNGKKKADHYVLVRNNGEIYDPWPRTDGKQIIPPGSEDAKRYQAAIDAVK